MCVKNLDGISTLLFVPINAFVTKNRNEFPVWKILENYPKKEKSRPGNIINLLWFIWPADDTLS